MIRCTQTRGHSTGIDACAGSISHFLCDVPKSASTSSRISSCRRQDIVRAQPGFRPRRPGVDIVYFRRTTVAPGKLKMTHPARKTGRGESLGLHRSSCIVFTRISSTYQTIARTVTALVGVGFFIIIIKPAPATSCRRSGIGILPIIYNQAQLTITASFKKHQAVGQISHPTA